MQARPTTPTSNMGAKSSKPRQRSTSTSSEARLAGYWPEKSLHETTTERRVTEPSPPREITHLSSIIDPKEISGDWTIRSPSGNLLGLGGYMNHPARPLSMRERQEKVRRAMEEKKASLGGCSALATVAEVEVRERSVSASCSSGSEKVVDTIEGGSTENTKRKKQRRFLCF